MARSVALWAGLACLVAACCTPLAAADRWANPPLTPTCDKQMDGILDQFYGDNSTLAGCDDDCRKQCNEVLHFTFTIMDKQRCFTEDRIRECLVVRPPLLQLHPPVLHCLPLQRPWLHEAFSSA